MLAARYNGGSLEAILSFYAKTIMSSSPWSTDVDKFLAMALASHLASAEQLQNAFDDFLEGRSRYPPPGSDVAAFCDYLVSREAFTRWQCDKLRNGQYKGFFLDNYKLLEWVRSDERNGFYAAEDISSSQRVLFALTPFHLSRTARIEYRIVDPDESQ